MRKCELIKQSKLLRIKNKILSNLFIEKYGFKLGEFNDTTGTERVNYKNYSLNELRRWTLHYAIFLQLVS